MGKHEGQGSPTPDTTDTTATTAQEKKVAAPTSPTAPTIGGKTPDPYHAPHEGGKA